MNLLYVALAGLIGGFGGAALRGAVRAIRDWRRNRRFGADLRARLDAALASPAGGRRPKLAVDDRWTSIEQEPPL